MVAVAGPVAHDLALALVERPVAAEREVVGSRGGRAGRQRAARTAAVQKKRCAMSFHREPASPAPTRRHHGRRSRLFRPLTSPAHEHGAPLRPEDRRAQVAGGVGARAHVGGLATTPRGADTYYVAEMLPYPSGEPHMGHLKNYAVGDAVAHFQRRIGRRVLHPIGYDAFGLPAENHAIRSGEHPRESTAKSIAAFQREFHSWGVSFDWSRELATNEPSYYRWTQWIFLKLYERGLAYRSEAAVNWCPKDQTVLANEQVIDGRCERCGTPVRGAPARAVVLPHHRLRRPPARRPRDGRVALARRAHAAELDRALRGRRGAVQRARDGRRLPGLHDAAGHAVRRDVLRHGARAPRRAAARRGHRARGGGPRLRQPRADRVARGPRRRRPREDRRAARPQRHQPGQRRAHPDVGGRLRADGVRHRRDHGGARATTRATTSSRRSTSCRSRA